MDFFKFLDYSVTPYHTVDFLRGEFVRSGFQVLNENSEFCVIPGNAYVVERGGALIAFRVPKQASSKCRFRIALAHTDFPALKVSPNPDKVCAGVVKLHTEVYGGAIYNSWLDRDLGYAGVIAFEKSGELRSKIFRGRKLLRIPELAVHLNRGVNQDGLKVNPQVDFEALWGADNSSTLNFVDTLQSELEDGARLLDFDVQLFDAQPAAHGGFSDEWIYSGRLDNLSSCHAIAEAFLESSAPENDFAVAAFLNNEEVGSTTREGASGNFLKMVLELIWNKSVPSSANLFETAVADSFALSIDMAHAEHPNHPEKSEPNHAPLLGQGIVLKINSQKRYASDVMSSARFKLICNRAGVPYQTFVMRNDMPCGSTVGPAISASLGISTVDIGEPMLSMHSIREMMALKDHENMILVVKSFLL